MAGARMKQTMVDTTKDWMILALAGIGINFPPHHYFGGLFLALAGAALARKFQPEQDNREWWVVVLGAFIAATIAAEVAQWQGVLVPVQIIMASAGFLSRYLTRFVLAMAGMVQDRTDTIFDRLLDRILPNKGDK